MSPVCPLQHRVISTPDRECLLFDLFFFFFNDTATTEIYTLSLHDALPIYSRRIWSGRSGRHGRYSECEYRDRKSTRLNSSHRTISYAVFCLKKKKKKSTENQNKIQYPHRSCIINDASLH